MVTKDFSCYFIPGLYSHVTSLIFTIISNSLQNQILEIKNERHEINQKKNN